MYSVLIADDEPYSVESIKNNIDWQSLDLEVACSVSNGADALAYIENHDVDIVLLDVNMPGMSGLEVCQHIAALDRSPQIIIISGYAEFSYVQKALQFNVLGYCLKPVNNSELTLCLQKAVRRITSAKTLQDGQEQFLDLLYSEDTEGFKEFCRKNNMTANPYIVVIKSYARSLILDGAFFTHVLGHNLTLHLFSHAPSLDSLRRTAVTNAPCSIGIMDGVSTLSTLAEDIEQCTANAYQSFLQPGRYIYGSHDVTSGRRTVEFARYAIKNNARNELLNCLNALKETEALGQFDIRLAVKLANLITTSRFWNASDDDYIYSFDDLYTKFDSFSEMIDYLIAGISTILESDTSAHGNNLLFIRIISKLNDCYNQNLNFTSLAEEFSVSPSQLSKIFKRESGKTMKQYLTDVRISKAKEFLLNTNSSILDIGMSIGFTDYYYFLRVFKKETGLTPSEFRSRNV